MSEKLNNKITTEIDYKAEVLKTYPGAAVEVIKSGYFSHAHLEYRVRVDTPGERPTYISNITSLSNESAWEAAYKALNK